MKTFIAGLTALLAVASMMSVSGFAVSLGEVNGDSEINAKDAAAILVHSANIGAGNDGTLSEEALSSADVNADGSVNSKDAAEILVYSAVHGVGGIYEFSGTPKEPFTASIDSSSVNYNRTDQTLYFTFSYENLPEECSALFLVVPENTPHTEEDALNSYIAAAYLQAQIGYAGFSLPAEKAAAGSYELRIYHLGQELDCVNFNIAEPLKAEITADSVMSSASSVTASFSAENLEANSHAWIGIIPHDTEHTEETASQNASAKCNLTECSDSSVNFNFSEKLSAGTYDLRIYDPDNGGTELSCVSFTIEPELSVYVSSVWYNAENEAIYVEYTAENVSDDCEVWVCLVPSGTEKTYSATDSAKIKQSTLKNWVDNGYNGFKVSDLSAGNYEFRICDPETQTILDWGSTTIPQKTPAWKTSYKSKVSGLSSGYMYSLYDVNSDGIPELFTSADTVKQNQVSVYTYSNGSLTYLGAYGRYGTVFANSGGYLMDYNWGAKNSELRTYYYFNGSSITEKDYLMYSEEYGTYSVNGNDVSKSTYNTYYSKYNQYSYREVGRTYAKTNTSPIDNY